MSHDPEWLECLKSLETFLPPKEEMHGLVLHWYKVNDGLWESLDEAFNKCIAQLPEDEQECLEYLQPLGDLFKEMKVQEDPHIHEEIAEETEYVREEILRFWVSHLINAWGLWGEDTGYVVLEDDFLLPGEYPEDLKDAWALASHQAYYIQLVGLVPLNEEALLRTLQTFGRNLRKELPIELPNMLEVCQEGEKFVLRERKVKNDYGA